MRDFSYAELIALPQLVQAWGEFRQGKANKTDIQEFGWHLEDNLHALHQRLLTKQYHHGRYSNFWVFDPKKRHIYKAPVADRVLHHLLYTYLYQIFDRWFIHDSYASRRDKGTHKAVQRLVTFCRQVSRNYTGSCWVLHCDIAKFFASVDHDILLNLLRNKMSDTDIMLLLEEVIVSFHSEIGGGKGIPLGNLTSQIFANIYLHELDIYIKHVLKAKYYIRYVDDFVLVSSTPQDLSRMIEPMRKFLNERLSLSLHPRKIYLRKLSWGVDFLGYIVLPRYILPRTKTKRRLLNKIQTLDRSASYHQMVQSYLGYLSHANTYLLQVLVKNLEY